MSRYYPLTISVGGVFSSSPTFPVFLVFSFSTENLCEMQYILLFVGHNRNMYMSVFPLPSWWKFLIMDILCLVYSTCKL